jgi:hypothetical protein
MKEPVWTGITFLSLECLKTRKLRKWGDWCEWREVRLESLGALSGKLLLFYLYVWVVGESSNWWLKMGDLTAGSQFV